MREEEVVRIFDIFFDYSVLLDTDEFFRRLIEHDEFQKTMSSAEFHYLAGKYIREREKKLGIKDKSLLAVCYEYGVPVYTSSPGDSSIGMNIAAKELQGGKLILNPNLDVNETASIVLAAKRGVVHTGKKQKKGGKSAIFILGGGSPKNFALQTEPQIQEVLGIDEKGHDYFLQVTDARPDTGGLSGATPAEAVSWGKVDPDKLPDAVVAYIDSTVALPLITSYALARHEPREPKRLYDRRDEFMKLLAKRIRKIYAKMKLQAELKNETYEIEIKRDGDKVFARVDDREYELEASEVEPNVYLLKNDNKIYEVFVAPQTAKTAPYKVKIRNQEFEINLFDPKRLRGAGAENEHGDGVAEIKTAMPGKLVRVLTQVGAEINKGDSVLVVEAMKMQNEMKSPKDGIVKEIRFEEGATVNAGDVLAIIE